MLNKQTKYIIYTAKECPKCEIQKEKWIVEGVTFEERDASRLKNPSDAIDTEALIESAMTNEQLPVIILRGNL